MRVTRRSLIATNLQLQAQLKASSHVTRQSLNDHVKQLKARNADLVKTVSDQAAEIAQLRKQEEKAS